MPSTSHGLAIVAALTLSFWLHASDGSGHPLGQGPSQGPAASAMAAKGVHCPGEFEAVFNPDTKVLTCRRDVVSWVVTSCTDKDFAHYVAKVGPDSCARTEIPGVGTPPGASGSRPVGCAAPGYAVVADRTGPRDRCERDERLFALPRPVS